MDVSYTLHKRLNCSKRGGLPEARSAPVIINKDNLGVLEWTRMLKEDTKRASGCSTRHYNIDVSHIVHLESLLEDSREVYSVRIRTQGPDYRFDYFIGISSLGF